MVLGVLMFSESRRRVGYQVPRPESWLRPTPLLILLGMMGRSPSAATQLRLDNRLPGVAGLRFSEAADRLEHRRRDREINRVG